MRISGIASGFDTDAMVKSMMEIERMKVNRFEQSKQTALWKQESYNTMNKAFANFILNTQKDMGLKKTSSTGSIANTGYKNVDYVKKATSSNEAGATVSSTSKAVNGSYKLDVKQLAEGDSFSSAKIDESILVGKKYLEFEINKEVIKVGQIDGNKDITMEDVAQAINNATKGDGKGVSLGFASFYDKTNGRLFIQSKESGTGTGIELTGTGDGGLLVNKLNHQEQIGQDGNNNPIFSSDSMKSTLGKKAIIKFNGVELEYSSNKINLNGLNIELKSIGETTINVSTNTEGIMEKIEKLVKDYNDLVDIASLSVNEKAYPGYKPLTAEERKAMSESDVKLWDEKAKSGLLNRDETIQRTLQSIRNDLYKAVEGLDPEFNHITKIGITTEKYSRGSAGGKLVIDTDKLKKAVEANPDAVMDLLFKDPAGKPYSGVEKPKKEDYIDKLPEYETKLKEYEDAIRLHEKTENTNRKANSGIFTNIYDNLITGMKAIVEKSGPGQDSDLLRGVKSNILIDFVTKGSISDIDKSVKEMNRQMDNLNILLAKKEDSYYAKFTAMEKAMHKMNGQSGWLSQQFG